MKQLAFDSWLTSLLEEEKSFAELVRDVLVDYNQASAHEEQSPKKLAKTIAYVAVKLGVLKVSAEKNILFDLESALSFDGESGPYVQYAYARANSILGLPISEKE